MARIVSPVKKINELWIEPLPAGKVIKSVRAIKVDRCTFLLGEDGNLYSDQVTKGCYMLHRWRFVNPLLNALNRLGVITRTEVRKHLEACRVVDDARDIQELAHQAQRVTKQLGMALTLNQRLIIRRGLRGKRR